MEWVRSLKPTPPGPPTCITSKIAESRRESHNVRPNRANSERIRPVLCVGGTPRRCAADTEAAVRGSGSRMEGGDGLHILRDGHGHASRVSADYWDGRCGTSIDLPGTPPRTRSLVLGAQSHNGRGSRFASGSGPDRQNDNSVAQLGGTARLLSTAWGSPSINRVGFRRMPRGSFRMAIGPASWVRTSTSLTVCQAWKVLSTDRWRPL